MKVKMEIDENLIEEEVIIKCKELSDEISHLQQLISTAVFSKENFVVHKEDREYYLVLDDILFFETDGGEINVHTANQMYKTAYKLYELEEMLPGHFIRVSKSTIANVRHIYSMSKNLSSASIVEFRGTHKKIYVSRHYYRPLRNKLEEMRNQI